MIRNNQNGRRRGRGGGAPRPQQGTGGGNYGNSGSRIDNRQRGNATQLLEKYKAMARDATQNGDRVQAEFYMQYADHYFRVLSEFRARDPQPAPRSTYDDDDDNYAGGPGQNYAPPGDRFDDDGEDERGGGQGSGPAERGHGDRGLAGSGGDRGQGDRGPGGNGSAASGGERQPYRANGERPQGGYQGQPRADRFDDRDGRPRYTRDGDDGRTEVPRTDGDGQRRDNGANAQRQDGDGPRGNDASRRDGGRGETWRGDGGRSDGGRIDSARSENGRGDNGRGEGARAGGFRRDDNRPRDWDGNRRDAGQRNAEPREAAPFADDAAALIGLPGPATLAPVAPDAATPVTPEPADIPVVDTVADVPAPRRRGRPRKVVADIVEG